MEETKKLKKLFIYSTQNDNRFLVEFREFDEEGNIISEIAFYEDGSIYEKVIHTFEDGHVVRSNYFSENEKASHTISFEYINNRVAKETTWYADGSLTIKNITYNAEENSDTVLITDEEENIEGKSYHQYNKEGKPILEIVFDEEGKDEIERTSFEYTDTNLPLKIETISKEDKPPFIRHFEYIGNDEGYIIDTIVRNENGEIMGSENRIYDSKGNIVSLEEVNNFTAQYRNLEWTFDDNGNNVAIRQFNKIGDLIVEILLDYNEDKKISMEETRTTGLGVKLKEYEYEYF